MLCCPICHFKKTHPKYKVEKYQYHECKKCKTLFLYPLPTKKAIKTYYSSMFEYTAGRVEESRIRKRADIILKKLKQLYPEGKTLLDIGSGYGYFLDEAQKSGLKSFGIEPNKKLAQFSVNSVTGNGVSQLTGKSIFNGTFQEYAKNFDSQKFDFITAIHVIEHVRRPLQFINQASRLARTGGILYIETPNYDSLLARTEKEKYVFLTPPDHIFLFSKRSFQLIEVGNPNLSIESISSYSYPEHFMGILKNKLKVRSETKSDLVNKLKVSNENLKLDIDSKLKIKNLKFIKYVLFDKLLAPIFTPLLDCSNRGSVLELYIRRLD